MKLFRKVVWRGYNENRDNLLTSTIKRLTSLKFTPTRYPEDSEIHTSTFDETGRNYFPSKWTYEKTQTVQFEDEKISVWSMDIVEDITYEMSARTDSFQFKVYSAATWCENPAPDSPSEITTQYHVLTDRWHPQYLVTTVKDKSKNKPAKTGYHFPLYGRQIYGEGEFERIVGSTAAIGSIVTTHVHVLWRRG